jgi:alpha-beta hydrolase superfamily lysophospholipase
VDDQLVPIEPARRGVQALVPPSQLTSITYPGARHEVLNETNREEVLGDVTRFVDRALR